MRRTVTVFFIFIIAGACLAQDKPSQSKEQFPLELSFINHAVSNDRESFPFIGTMLEILHPGFSLGTEYAYKQDRHMRLYQDLHMGYYFNKYNARALFAKSAVGYRHTLSFGLFADAALGLGYLHSFHPTDVWKLNRQGEYERAKDKGKGALIVLLGISIGYDFSRKLGWPVSVFVRYQPYVQTSYSTEDSSLAQGWLQLGIRVQIW